jgi:hypothetical protein
MRVTLTAQEHWHYTGAVVSTTELAWTSRARTVKAIQLGQERFVANFNNTPLRHSTSAAPADRAQMAAQTLMGFWILQGLRHPIAIQGGP